MVGSDHSNLGILRFLHCETLSEKVALQMSLSLVRLVNLTGVRGEEGVAVETGLKKVPVLNTLVMLVFGALTP